MARMRHSNEGESRRTPREVSEGIANTKTGRASTIMATGTLVSRILGFVRQWLLVAAIGGFGIADAFNTANTLPNTLYNLLAGGILNAILVPTIVRALANNKGKDGTDQVNALLTLASVFLLGLTVLTVLLAWPLVWLFAGGMEKSMFNLAVIFALWCLPQIFFYGTYALFGQVLNSLSSFGPYMWAPVVNNLIGIAGLGLFLTLYGTAPAHNFEVSTWGFGRVALLAGTMTFGIVVQALILVFPLKNLGFELRANFHFRGLGFRQTGRVAAWAFVGLLCNATMNLIVTRIGSEANGAGDVAGVFYASNAIFNYATMLYMLPQSLVTTSVATSVFTAMAYHATRDNLPALADDYVKGVRLSSLFTLPLAGMLIVGALPLANLTASVLPPEQAHALAVILIILSLGIPGQTIFSSTTRVFYSLENTRTLALLMLWLPLLTAALGLFAFLVLDPSWWMMLAAAGEPLALTFMSGISIVWLQRHGFPTGFWREIMSHYLRCVVAVVLAALPAWALLHWGFSVPQADSGLRATLLSGLFRSLAVGAVMTPLYFLFTWLMNVTEVRGGINKVISRLRQHTS